MPNPKTGTVTPDVAKAVADIKGGKINYRVDKAANLHLVIGKVSFPTEKLVENYAAALDEVLRAKPAAAKGRYLKRSPSRPRWAPASSVDPTRHAQPAGDRRGLTDPLVEPTPLNRHRPSGVVAVQSFQGAAVSATFARRLRSTLMLVDAAIWRDPSRTLISDPPKTVGSCLSQRQRG